MKYAIVIPAKDEEETIGNVLSAVVEQTLPCVRCLVVDDGSSDKTPDIIEDFMKKYEFIDYYRNESDNEYILGGHVVRLFHIGKSVLDEKDIDYDYIVKMDADIEFGSDFMQKIAGKLTKDTKWGIVSGTPYYIENGKTIFEISPQWHSNGQFKVYNKKCLEEIGGLKKMLGWDCADNIQAIEKGYKTRAFRDIHYKMHRKVGGKSSLLKGRIKHGIGAYNLRYSVSYMSLKLLHDFFKPPYVLGSAYYIYGYIKAWSAKAPRPIDKSQAKLLRNLFWQSFAERFKNRKFIFFQNYGFKGHNQV